VDLVVHPVLRDLQAHQELLEQVDLAVHQAHQA
jgi:hypothetical protein